MVAVGQPVTFEVDAYPGRQFAGTIRYVSPALEANQRALTVEAAVPNPQRRAETRTVRHRAHPPAESRRRRFSCLPTPSAQTKRHEPRVRRSPAITSKSASSPIGQRVDVAIEIVNGLKAGERVATTNVARSSTDGVKSGALGVRHAVARRVIASRRPVFATVLILSITVVGIFSFTPPRRRSLPEGRPPDRASSRRCSPARAPEQIETEISDKIEEAVNTISGIDELRSISSEGVSQVIVTFLLDKDTNIAAQEVRDKVNGVLPLLPEDDPAAARRQVRSGRRARS